MLLSRALSRAAVNLGRPLTVVRTVSTTSVLKRSNALDDGLDIFENEKNPQRDHVNFPRRKMPEHPDPVRHWWIPEEYFSFFYPKTGVTGPYMFGASVCTFLWSKEIWVMEHDFYVGIALATAFAILGHKLGPGLSTWLDQKVDEETKAMDHIRQKEIDRCKEAIDNESNAQFMAGSYEQLIAAKKENVGLQLESEYRARLKEAYTQVKRRLDYQLQTANVIRSNEQKHMVDWIIKGVLKSITAKQEEDALKKCVADLKGLAKA